MSNTDQRVAQLQAELDRLHREKAKAERESRREKREQQLELLARAGLRVEPRPGSRFWNLVDADCSLIAVTVYKRGALAAGAAIATARIQNTAVRAVA